MKKIFNKKVLSFMFLVGIFTLLMAVGVYAEDLKAYIGKLHDTIKGIATVFVMLAAVTTAVLYMASSVNPKLKDKGKEALYALIIGVIVLTLSKDIATWIGNVTNRPLP